MGLGGRASRGGRKLIGGKDAFVIFIVVMVSMYITSVKKILHSQYMQFIMSFIPQ